MSLGITKDTYSLLYTGEYFECVKSCYNEALHFVRQNVARLASDTSKNISAVLDIDETILCSVCNISLSPHANVYIGDMLIEHSRRTEIHCKDKKYDMNNPLCLPLPGAIDFCNELNKLVNGNVILLTGRGLSAKDITRDNLAYYGIQFKELYMNPDPNRIDVGLFKEHVREQLCKDNVIIICMGDKPTDMGHQSRANFLVKNPFY